MLFLFGIVNLWFVGRMRLRGRFSWFTDGTGT